ncbi:putative leucine-rich repeat-containing protein DDB_G0290503 [Onthophagus taurus]|uniref:putative leucine-rich repeat-containing protein DDB_G0290503 n=1 Tax=Onthophagus taurus TaxID=166361 RepID=UPI0039BEBB4D
MKSKMFNLYLLVILFSFHFGITKAQDSQETVSCGGSIATAVVVTIIILLVLGGAIYYGWKRYGKYKNGKHLILEKDPEKGDEYAFDNPGFKEPGLSPLGKIIEKPTAESSNKPKWANWAPLSALTCKSEKKKTVDDSAIGENEIKVVSLRSHDFTGLGFNICGNMRNGIFIKDVLQHGPASESGKLNPGDRITSVTINFEHMVYEDALTILSYASPYEVVVQATNGKLSAGTTQCARPVHPLYKSASSTDLLQINRSAKKRLFQAEELNESLDSNYSSLQKTRSNATTLERTQSDSPVQKTPQKKTIKNALTPEQLKSQLEKTILEDHKETLKNKQNFDKTQQKVESETQKTDSSYQKFGIKVFPIENKEQKSPKIAELSQNDNNINIELSDPKEVKEVKSFDEVDKKSAPPVKKREKKPESFDEHFKRGGSLTGSGIKRDENGIPQEIPSHMYNAALAARRNRTSSQENLEEKVKKQKGKAPPPPELQKENQEKLHQNLDEIYTAENEIPPIKTPEIIQDIPMNMIKPEIRQYESDSDQETDNQSSVNTIELNSNDITIHQTEDGEDKQNRRTASTGDLSKIQRIKSNTGTLERAQSLDITDTGIPALGKKRKAPGQFEENFDSIGSSNDSLYRNTLINKEPRLSLILDGLNTFQRNRLKKSTEWGNLEDAILNLNKSDSSENCETGERMFDNESNDSSFDRTTPELDALVNKIKEIKEETTKNIEEQEKEMRASWNEASETLTKAMESFKEKPVIDDVKYEIFEKKNDNDEIIDKNEIYEVEIEDPNINVNINKNSSFVTDVLNAVSSLNFEDDKNQLNINQKQTNNLSNASTDFLIAERKDYLHNNLEDTNVSDDIKVSRHSLSNDKIKPNEIPVKPHLNENVSNITISDRYSEKKPHYEIFPQQTTSSTTIKDNKLYKTDDKILVSTPDLIKNVSIAEAIHDLNEVTIEGPTSLTFEIKSPDVNEPITNKSNIMCEDLHFSSLSNGNLHKDDHHQDQKQNNSLTYITEIQVITPNHNKNVSEVEVVQKTKNLDNDFENFVKNFESKTLETKSISTESIPEMKSPTPFEKIDAEKELHKIQEIAEEQLKKLPEMRFSTSSYEPLKIPEKRQSQIEILRSNFERSPPKTLAKPETPIKSRIPIATTKTPPTSPERRDSKNEFEMDKEIIEIMTSGKYQQPKNPSKNVTVTSIRSSKIPSGLPTYSNRPPVPPRKSENQEGSSIIQLSSNGNTETSFKQWVFSPSSDNSITNITVAENHQMEK